MGVFIGRKFAAIERMRERLEYFDPSDSIHADFAKLEQAALELAHCVDFLDGSPLACAKEKLELLEVIGSLDNV